MQIEHRQEAVSDEHGRPVRLAAKKKAALRIKEPSE